MAKKSAQEVLTIPHPRMSVLHQEIVGTSPYVQLRFSEKARETLRRTHEGGLSSSSRRKKDPRSFEQEYEQCTHRGPNGEYGIPATAFRAGAIAACRTVGFKMTVAKLAFFVSADFFDPRDGTPLVEIRGTPEMHILPVRNANGNADLRTRAIWRNWSATLRIRFDADLFREEDVLNLLLRVGQQVGIGEGRADSKSPGGGMGWGHFELGQVGAIERAA